ncbi:MAG: MBL fold metallo-hydrolase [Rhizobiaceae bacterium]|nr:MBL fold metallo-hydrolase [Rhizobiaceae bacterium]
MMHSRMIGDVKVTNVIEYFGPTHDPAVVFPSLSPERLSQQVEALGPSQYVPLVNRFVIAIQIWIVQAGKNVVVIDTGVGNHKKRPAARMNMLNTLVPEWIAAAGVSFDAVTHVVNTHLHSDHVGWNTRLIDGEWKPTFPNARYYMPKTDFDFFDAQYQGGNRQASAGSFEDSVLPILAAGMLDLVGDEGRIADLLDIAPVPGHTPGQISLSMRSKGEEGIFCADIFHSPIQILLPDINTAFCMIPELAIETRARFLETAADRQALIMPCHFGVPHCGYIRRAGEGRFAFQPEARSVR